MEQLVDCKRVRTDVWVCVCVCVCVYTDWSGVRTISLLVVLINVRIATLHRRNSTATENSTDNNTGTGTKNTAAKGIGWDKDQFAYIVGKQGGFETAEDYPFNDTAYPDGSKQTPPCTVNQKKFIPKSNAFTNSTAVSAVMLDRVGCVRFQTSRQQSAVPLPQPRAFIQCPPCRSSSASLRCLQCSSIVAPTL